MVLQGMLEYYLEATGILGHNVDTMANKVGCSKKKIEKHLNKLLEKALVCAGLQ